MKNRIDTEDQLRKGQSTRPSHQQVQQQPPRPSAIGAPQSTSTSGIPPEVIDQDPSRSKKLKHQPK